MLDDKSKPIYWIIAGHHQEYVDYMSNIRSNHPEKLDQYDYRYVSDPNRLRGQRDIEGSFIGTWYLKPEATQIWAIIRASHVNPSTERTLGMFKARMVLEQHGKPIGARGASNE
jgi:hypothetical protein